jgi:hypothetical protein
LDSIVLPASRERAGFTRSRSSGLSLLARGLIVEMATDSHTRADAALNRIWRNDAEGRAIILHITDAGLAAIGIEPDAADGANTGATEAPVEPAPKNGRGPKKAAPTGANTAAPRKARDGTKQATLIAMLRRPEGATIAQIVEATKWLPHTVRGVFAGALKKKLGLEVTSEKVEGGDRIYRLPPA